MQVASAKGQLRKLTGLLHQIQEDHKNYVADPFWKSEFVSDSDPEYGGLDNETAMREREADFHTLSKDARKQLGLMEQLTEVSPDNHHYGPHQIQTRNPRNACNPRTTQSTQCNATRLYRLCVRLRVSIGWRGLQEYERYHRQQNTTASRSQIGAAIKMRRNQAAALTRKLGEDHLISTGVFPLRICTMRSPLLPGFVLDGPASRECTSKCLDPTKYPV
jgi:hypothetical protein